METDEVCGRPLDPFAVATFILLGYRGKTDLIRLRHLPKRGRLGGRSRLAFPSVEGKAAVTDAVGASV